VGILVEVAPHSRKIKFPCLPGQEARNARAIQSGRLGTPLYRPWSFPVVILALAGLGFLLLLTVNDPRLIPFGIFFLLVAVFLTWTWIPILRLHLREKRRLAADHD